MGPVVVVLEVVLFVTMALILHVVVAVVVSLLRYAVLEGISWEKSPKQQNVYKTVHHGHSLTVAVIAYPLPFKNMAPLSSAVALSLAHVVFFLATLSHEEKGKGLVAEKVDE